MPQLSEAFEKLERFDNIAGVAELVSEVSLLLPADQVTDDDLNQLRARLKTLLARRDVTNGGVTLAQAAYHALLGLAEYKPLHINDEDMFSGDPIAADDCLYVADGYRFSIRGLVRYHNERPSRWDLNESPTSKYLLNPYAQQAFSEFDVAHIVDLVNAKHYRLLNLKPATLPRRPYLRANADSSMAARFFQPRPELRPHLTPNQRAALVELAERGLTEQHLLNCTWADSDEDGVYGSSYRDALIHLMTRRGDHNFSAYEAIDELEELDHYQAKGIAQGLSRAEVVDLVNCYQVKALVELGPRGFTVEHAKQYLQGSMSVYLLNALTTWLDRQENQTTTVDQAFLQLKDLPYYKLEGIARGFTIEDVAGMTGIEQLVELQPRQVRRQAF